MSLITKAVLLVLVVSSLFLPVDAARAAGVQREGSLIVKLARGLSASEQDKVFAAHGGRKKGQLQSLRLHVLRTSPADLDKTLAQYKGDPRVESVEIDQVRKAAAVSNDPSYASQWALPKIGWDRVFGVTNATGGSIVAVLDSGVDATHPDLAGRVLPGTSILDGSDALADATGHGTEMAGIIAAVADNGTGIAGVAPSGVKVLPVTVLDANGEGLDSDIIAGVRWAADNGADVILMPFSNPTYSQNLQDAIDYAWSKGAVLVAAAGNNGVSSAAFPAADRGVVGVAATDQNDSLATISNYGSSVYLAAPGVEIYTTARGGNYTSVSGTSASSAVVAGVAAFLKAVDPSLANGVVVGRLGRSADPVGTVAETGHGRVNLANALADGSTDSVKPSGVASDLPYTDPYTADNATVTTLANASIPANTAAPSPAWTTLTGPVLTEGVNKDIGTGTIILNVPAGFEFNPAATVSATVTKIGTGNGATLAISTVTASATAITITISGRDGSGTLSKITWAGIQVRPLSATTLASGNLTRSGTASILSVNSTTNFGTLTEIKADQTVTFNQPVDKTYGDASFTVAATASSSLPVTISVLSGPASITPAGVVTLTGAGTVVLRASQSGDTTYNAAVNVDQSFAVSKAPLTVSANDITRAYNTVNPVLTASYSGFLGGDSFASSVTGSPVLSTTATQTSTVGSYPITVTAGTLASNKYSFSTLPGLLSVTAAAQTTVTVTAPPSATYQQPGLSATAVGGSGTGAYVYDAGSSTACSVDPSSGALNITAASGRCTITAAKAADANYLVSAASAPATVSVGKADQSALILTVTPPTVAFGSTATLSTTGGSGTGTVSYSAGASIGCSISGNLLSVVTPGGSCSVTATSGTDANYNAASSATVAVALLKGNQTAVTVSAPASASFGQAGLFVTASGGSGSGAYTYDAGSSAACSVDPASGALTIGGSIGSCSITATKAGDTNYLDSAPSDPATVPISKAAQSISFGTLPEKTYGAADFGTGATVSSGLIVSYSSDNPAVATITAEGLIHIVGQGAATITASQTGDDNYSAAAPVSQVLNVAKAVITVTANNASRAYGASDPAFSATYTGFVNGDTAAVISGEAGFSSTASSLSPVGSYAIIPSAGNLAANNYSFSFANGTLSVALATQSITFNPLPATTYGAESFGLSVTPGASGHPVSFTSSNTAVATVTGSTVTIVGAGTSVITADQPGDANYGSATAQQTLSVDKAPLTVAADNAGRLYNTTNPVFTYSYSGFVKGETEAVLTGLPTLSTTAVATSPVGTYPITVSQGTLVSDNYSFSFANGTLAVGVVSQSISFDVLPGKTYGDLAFDLSATGGASGNQVVFGSSNTAVATVSGNTVTIVGAGSANITASQAGNDNYALATAQQVLSVAKAPLSVTAQDASRPYNANNPPLTVVYGGFVNGDTDSALGGTPTLSTTAEVNSPVGNYPVVVTVGSLFSNNYSFSYLNGNLAVTQADQAAVTVAAPVSASFNQAGLYAVASGGSSTGAYSYSAGSSSACSADSVSGALTISAATGTCSITAIKAGDSNYKVSAPSAPATVAVGLAPQAPLTALVTPSALSYGSTAGLSTIGGSGSGEVSFSAAGSTGCTVSGSTLTVTDASGLCSVTATKAADASYAAVSSAAVPVILNKAAQAVVTVTAPASASFGQAGLFAVASGGSSSGAYSYSAGSSSACSVNAVSGALTISAATGTCSITASKAADNNYLVSTTSNPATVSLSPASQLPLSALVTPSALTYGTTAALTATGGSGSGDLTFSAAGSTGCSVSGSTLMVTNASGLCTVTATKAADANYAAVSSAAVSVALSKAIQGTVSITAPSLATFNQAGLFAVASGGSGSGLYSYSAGSSSACSVHAVSGALTISAATGTCAITATRAADNNFLVSTDSAPATIAVTVAAQAPLTALVTPSAVSYGSTAALSATGGSSNGGVTFSAAGSTGCTVSGSTLTVTDASGICTVTATKAADANYSAVSSPAVSVTLKKATQLTVTVTAPASATYGQTGQFAVASGGSSSGAYSYSAGSSNACSVDALTGALTISAATGTCSITATRAADNNYQVSAASTPATVLLSRATQTPLTALVTPTTVVYGSSAALSAIGGSSGSPVTFSASGSTGCSVSGAILTVTNASGTCTVTATKAADANYFAITSAAVSVTLNKSDQSVVTVTAPASASYGRTGLFAVASGGSGSGVYSYSAGSSNACSVNALSGALTISAGAGTCSITAMRGADTNHLDSAASTPATVAVGPANQSALTAVVSPSTITYGSSATLSATGGNGTGQPTFSAGGSDGCSVSGTTLNVINASGTCSVTATRAADANYNAVTSAAIAVSLMKATPNLSWSAPASIAAGTTLSGSQLNASSTVGGSFSYTPPAGTLLPSGTNQTLSVLFTPTDGNNYTTATKSVSLIVNAVPVVPISGQPSGGFVGTKTGTSFTVLRSEAGSAFTAIATTTTSTNYTDTSSLKSNTVYQYAVSSNSDPTQTVFLSIRTPLYNGWNIVAVPYETATVAASALFKSPVSAVYQWTPTQTSTEESTTQYGTYATVSSLVPGNGYFVKALNSTTILAYSGTPGPTSAAVTLKPGWTMIANPSPTNKTDLGTNWLVDGIPLHLWIENGKIGGSVYWWNGTTYDSWTVLGDNPQLEPWKGYWIINLEPVNHTLTIQ